MTALSDFVRERMDDLDMRWYSEVARATRQWDAPPRGKGGLSADTIARIVHGRRNTIQERTLHLLALALECPPGLLRLHVEDRTNDPPREFQVPRAAHHALVTERIHRSWEEIIRSTADALDDARREGYEEGYAAARHDFGVQVHDPVAVAEAMADIDRLATG